MNIAVWTEPRQNGVALIDHLFNRLDGLYPHRWRSAFASETAISNWREAWAEGLAEEGLTGDEIKRGLAECRRRFDWPPSLPEFIGACRPAIDYEQAFLEAVTQTQNREEGRDKWSHPAIYWAAATIGRFDLRNATWAGMKSRWTATMKTELDKRGWPKIPPHREALPAPGQCSVSRDEAHKRLAAIREQLLEKMDKTPRDGFENALVYPSIGGDEKTSQNALEAARRAYLEDGKW